MKEKLTFFLIIVLLACAPLFASDPDAPELYAFLHHSPPVIDGEMDESWEDFPWYSLNHVWMNWGETVDSSDYYGRFKVGWSGETQLLYFFVEITDDVLIERFAEKQNTNHYNDIVEVFIDEDNSGGLHVFDGDGSWGTNAENAFSYHLTPLNMPEEGSPVTDFTVSDLDGTGWNDSYSPEYISHFPEAVLRKSGDQYFWEFSLIVYDDSYDSENEENNRPLLDHGKVMGLALAYCETDNPDVYLREMFFGSFEGDPSELGDADGGANYGYNETWKDATDYNMLRILIPESTPSINRKDPLASLHIQSLPGRKVQLRLQNELQGNMDIEIYDLTGRKISRIRDYKNSGNYSKTMNISSQQGIYLVKVQLGEFVGVRKVLVRE